MQGNGEERQLLVESESLRALLRQRIVNITAKGVFPRAKFPLALGAEIGRLPSVLFYPTQVRRMSQSLMRRSCLEPTHNELRHDMAVLNRRHCVAQNAELHPG